VGFGIYRKDKERKEDDNNLVGKRIEREGEAKNTDPLRDMTFKRRW
jgi:SspJ family small acid-soluble spore protein